jgi:protein SCO1/2
VSVVSVQLARGYPVQPDISVNQNTAPPITARVGFDQKLGFKFPTQAVFRSDQGQLVTLQNYLGKRPMILAMVYYGCPNLCTLVLNGLFKALEELPFSAGKDFSVVLVSINPKETEVLAASKKKTYLNRYRKAGGDAGIHFLTGDHASIETLAKAIGFQYRYDEESKQYAHPSGIIVLTPDGHISRYLYGIEYSNRDLDLALKEASTNKIGKLARMFLLLCFHYDAATGKYSLAILDALKMFGFLTAAALLGGIAWMVKKEFNQRKIPPQVPTETPPRIPMEMP